MSVSLSIMVILLIILSLANNRNNMHSSPDQLKKEIASIIDRFPGTVGLYMHDMNTHQIIEINADEYFPMASTFKIPVLIQLYRDRDAGLLSLNEKITLTPDAKVLGSGLLKNFLPGASLTLNDLALMMITISDNTATDLIIDKITLKRINQMLETNKLDHLIIYGTTRQQIEEISKMTPEQQMNGPRHATTPRAMGHLFEKLIAGDLVSMKSTGEIRSILHQQLLNTRMPRNMTNLEQMNGNISAQKGIKIAHKTGTTLIATNDVGIIEMPNRREIILCIYTKKDPAKVATYQAEQVIGELTQSIVQNVAHYSDR